MSTDEDRKESAATLRRAFAALGTVSDDPGTDGRISIVWDDGSVYVVEEESIGLNLAIGSEPKGRAVWLSPEVLPLIVEAAQRVLARREQEGRP